ncbi:MAG: hypothetical protein LBV71_02345 [Prevotella sp.]|nr:hypothetical protein [Prevotella sp.]
MVAGDYYDSETGEHVHNDEIDDNKVYIRTSASTQAKNDGRIGGYRVPYKDEDRYIGQFEEIPDKTELFTAQLQATNDFFASKKDEYSGFFNIKSRLDFFESQVTNEAPYDIKRLVGPFHEDTETNWANGYAFFEGKLFRSDDFGNFNYGVAGKALGISEFLLELGAGVNQIKNSFTRNVPTGGLGSFFDDNKDNLMITLGVKYYNENFKK